MKFTYKYRIYPSTKQVTQLEDWLEILRRLWNFSLEDRKTVYEERKETLSSYTQMKHLTMSRAKYPELQAIPVCFARGVIGNLDLAYKAFFRRCKNGEEKKGFARHKKVGEINSLVDRDAKGREWVKDGNLNLPKFGIVKMVYHRPIPEAFVIAMVVVRRVAGKWYVSLAGDDGLAVPDNGRYVKAVGLDVGLTHLVVTSDGEVIDPPQYYRKAEAKLTKLQRRLSRKKKGSANRRKAILKVARAHHDVANARSHFVHELSRQLVDEYDLIAVEDRIAKALMQKDGGNGRQSRSMHKGIADAGWAELAWALEYKCERAGKTFVAVPARGTTQECSGCGAIVPKTLYDRRHACPECGLDIDRDFNAAINIRQRGIDTIGQCLSESDASGEQVLAEGGTFMYKIGDNLPKVINTDTKEKSKDA